MIYLSHELQINHFLKGRSHEKSVVSGAVIHYSRLYTGSMLAVLAVVQNRLETGVCAYKVAAYPAIPSGDSRLARTELSSANMKRCDAICYKVAFCLLLVIAFAGGILSHVELLNAVSMGWMILAVLFAMSILRTTLFVLFDKKGM